MIVFIPMPRARSNPAIEKVAISLPADLLREAERLRAATGESRSALFRRSLELLLGRMQHESMVREYVAGYLAHPETRDEIDAATATASEALAEEPWE